MQDIEITFRVPVADAMKILEYANSMHVLEATEESYEVRLARLTPEELEQIPF